MTRRNMMPVALMLVLFFIGPVASFGACDYQMGSNPAHSLRELYDTGCLGGSRDETTLAKGISGMLKVEIPSDSPRRTQIGTLAIDQLQDSFGHLAFSGGRNELEEKLARALRLVEAELTGSVPQWQIAKPGVWALDLEHLSVQLSDTLTLDFQKSYLQQGCARVDSPECPQSFERAVQVLRHLDLVRRSLDYIFRDRELAEVIMQAKLRRNQWDRYFEQGYPQWPWELWSNGRLYRDQVEKDPGLAEPPSWQLVWLHPDVALEYVDGAEDGDQFKPAVSVEFIGGDWWSWDEQGRQKGPWGLPVTLGVGVIGTFSDRAGSEDWGMGGVLRINHSYNVGVTTRSGNDLGIFVSANLSKLITGVMAKKEQWFGMR